MNCFSVLGKSLFFPKANKIGHFSIFSVPLSGHLTNDHGIEGHRSLPVMTSQTASYSKDFSLWPCVMVKAAKYEIQKPSTWRATLFRCKFGSMSPVFHLAWSTCRATKTFVAGWRKLLRKVERGSTLSNKFWLCCSFFINLTTCRASNVLGY